MKLQWLMLIVAVFVFSLTGCTDAKKTVKDADEWVKTNLW